MSVITQKNILNIVPGMSAPLVVHVSQGDSGVELVFTLVDGDEIFDPTGTVISVHGIRQDGNGWGPVACARENGMIKFTLPDAATAVKGSGMAEVVISNESETVGTTNFAILVETATFPQGVTYANDVSVYEAILAYVQNMSEQTVANVEADLAEEIANRIAADAVLQGEINTNANNITTNANNIAAANGEIASHSSQIQTLTNNLSAETTARQNADTTLQGNIDSEASTRASADASLREAIDALVSPSGQSVVVDKSLSISGAAADAKTTGDETTTSKSAIAFLSSSIDTYDYAKIPNMVDGVLNLDGDVVENNNYKTTDFMLIRKGETLEILCDLSIDSYNIERCIYDLNKTLTQRMQLGIGMTYKYYCTDDIYMRVSIPSNVWNHVKIIVDGFRITKQNANYSFDAIRNGGDNIVLEQGNISQSGTDSASTLNFRTKGYIPHWVKSVSCNEKLRFAVARYLKDGRSNGRSGFIYTYNSDFDFINYEYRITFNRIDNQEVINSDYNMVRFSNKYIDTWKDFDILSRTYNIDASVPFSMEQGNISMGGGEITSDKNLRSVYMLPNYIKSISTDGSYVCGVAKYNRSTGAFLARTQINYSYYDDFDFENYSYRVLMGNTLLSDMTVADAKNLHINTATLDAVVRNKNSIHKINKKFGLPLLNDYLNKDSYANMARALKGIGMADEYLADGFNITDNAKNSHDATICMLNNIIYCVRSLYSGSGDNASNDNAAVVLTTSDLDGTNINTINVAKKDDILDGITIVGGCGSPNLYLDGTDIHIYFTAHITNDYTILHCVYDTLTGTLGNYSIITINGNACDTSVVNNLLGLQLSYSVGQFNAMQMNASIGFDNDVAYVGLCAGTNAKSGRGAILKSDDFVNWETFTLLDPNIITPIYEVACYALSGYLFVMARSAYDNLKGYIAKYSIESESVLEEYYLLNGSSRPDFVYHNGNLYLFNVDSANRQTHSFVRVDTNSLIQSDMKIQANASFDYMRGFTYNSKIYASSTIYRDGLACIHINELDMDAVSDETVHNSLLSLIQN